MPRIGRWLPAAVAAVALAGCGSTAGRYHAHFRAPHPIYKVGAPYEVNGVWYTPTVDYDYDRTGTASWYGEQFNNRYTANGEVFDMNGLTAAHTTLPLPTIVQVTNLQNGRSLRLRVNDRGPFIDGRILDVSRRAAQLLGFEVQGTAPVRVQVLKEPSIQAAAALIRSNGGDPAVVLAEAQQRRPHTMLASAVPAAAPGPPAPAPSPPPPAPVRAAAFATLPSERIFVQAAAFSHARDAQRVLARVAPLGNAEIVHNAIGGIDFYRVRLGPLPDVEAADRMLARLLGGGYSQARIVVD